MPHVNHLPVTVHTAYTVDYADLAVLDLSQAHTSEGLALLAEQARSAMREQGFFYVINHGLSTEQVRSITGLRALRTANSPSAIDRPHI